MKTPVVKKHSRFSMSIMAGVFLLISSMTPSFAFVDTNSDASGGSGYRVGGACYPDLQTATDAYVTDPAHQYYANGSEAVPTFPACPYSAVSDVDAFDAAVTIAAELGGAVLGAWACAWGYTALRRVL